MDDLEAKEFGVVALVMIWVSVGWLLTDMFLHLIVETHTNFFGGSGFWNSTQTIILSTWIWIITAPILVILACRWAKARGLEK
jgi:hypothetical protein